MPIAHAPLRVLHVYRTYFPDPPGGVPEAIRQICLATRPHGIESTVFCLSPIPQPARIERNEGVVWRARSWAAPASCDLGGLAAIRQFTRLQSAHDVVHYHFPWPYADILHLAAHHPLRPGVMTYHSDIIRQALLGAAYAPLMSYMLSRMDTIVATSPNYARTSRILSNPAWASKVVTIPLGMADRAGAQPRRPVPSPRRPYFLFVGALRYYKGLPTLLKAASMVDADIVIAGKEPPGSTLREQARQAGLENVTFAGMVSDDEKDRLLEGCQAFVLPSDQRSEAFGMVLCEAAMFSRPMITCEIGTGTTFVNVHGETGLVVPPGNPGALAEAMNTLLHDRDAAAVYGRQARERYEALFSGAALGKAHADLYRRLVTG